jgi:hypothetical protein
VWSHPKVKDTAWPKTRIDYYILAKMEAAGLKPAPQGRMSVFCSADWHLI